MVLIEYWAPSLITAPTMNAKPILRSCGSLAVSVLHPVIGALANMKHETKDFLASLLFFACIIAVTFIV